MRAGTRVPWLCAWVARRPSSAVWTEDKLALPLRRDEALVALACPRTSTRPSLARGLSRARLSLSCAHAPASTRPADSPPSRSSSRPSPSAFALTRFVSLSLLRSLAGARSPGAARLASYTLSRAKRAETRRPQRATPTDPPHRLARSTTTSMSGPTSTTLSTTSPSTRSSSGTSRASTSSSSPTSVCRR